MTKTPNEPKPSTHPGSHVPSQPTAPTITITLQTGTSWNNKPYQGYPQGTTQLSVVRYSIPAHSSLPWHTHVIPSTAFVISGSLTLQSIDGTQQVFHAGDAFAESVGDEHRVYTDNDAAEVVCTYVGVNGAPLSIPTGRSGSDTPGRDGLAASGR